MYSNKKSLLIGVVVMYLLCLSLPVLGAQPASVKGTFEINWAAKPDEQCGVATIDVYYKNLSETVIVDIPWGLTDEQHIEDYFSPAVGEVMMLKWELDPDDYVLRFYIYAYSEEDDYTIGGFVATQKPGH